jgi:hypothetical protein
MKFIDTIKEASIKYWLSAIFAVLILLIGSIYQDVIPLIYPEIIQKLSKEVFLKITTLAIILFFLSIFVALFIYLHYRPKLKTKFGILWDKNKEAYCPACRNPLSAYFPYRFDSTTVKAFKCIKCDKYIPITHNSKIIDLDDAKKML